MRTSHDERLNREILIDIRSAREENQYTFELTVPYRFALTEPDKVIPLESTILPLGVLYTPMNLDEFIKRTVPVILREGLSKQPYELEYVKTPRKYENDQLSIDKKFRLNAFGVSGIVKLKDLELRISLSILHSGFSR